MNQELLEAIQNGRDWLDRFRLREYPKAFKEYVQCFGPLYMAAVRETAGEETALNALAGALLDGIEEGWRCQRFWNRSAARVDDKQMLVSYLSPMLLELEEPGCGRLAELLRDGWEVRRPKDAYCIASYQDIRRGFRNSILGIDLNSRHLEPDRDR